MSINWNSCNGMQIFVLYECNTTISIIFYDVALLFICNAWMPFESSNRTDWVICFSHEYIIHLKQTHTHTMSDKTKNDVSICLEISFQSYLFHVFIFIFLGTQRNKYKLLHCNYQLQCLLISIWLDRLLFLLLFLSHYKNNVPICVTKYCFISKQSAIDFVVQRTALVF